MSPISHFKWYLSGIVVVLFKVEYYSKQCMDIDFNHKKSNLIKFGRVYNKDNIDTLKLNGCDVTWVNRLNYLGIHIVSGNLINIDVSDTIRKFYAAANAIAYRTRRVNEMARLSLFESLLYLSYAMVVSIYILQIKC